MELAKRILSMRDQQTGLMRLWIEKRQDLAVETLVLQPSFRRLSTEAELDTARQSLNVLDYPIDQ